LENLDSAASQESPRSNTHVVKERKPKATRLLIQMISLIHLMTLMMAKQHGDPMLVLLLYYIRFISDAIFDIIVIINVVIAVIH
jgi:hypothetical protein